MKQRRTPAANGQKKTAVLFLAVMGALVVLPLVGASFTTFLVTRILIMSLASMSLILLAGYGGLISFAQISFYGIAAYGLGILVTKYGLGFGPALLLSLAITVLVAAVFALIAVRTKGNYFIMMTLSFGQLVYLSAMQWVEFTGGFNGITGVPPIRLFGFSFSTGNSVYYLVLAVAALCYLLLKRVVASPFGLALQGVRDNATKMSALGFYVAGQKYVAFLVAALVAAIAGLLSIAFYGLVSPNTVTLSNSVMLLFVALIGCISRFEGALVGAAVYVLLEDFLSQYTARYMMFIGIFFILVVLFMPQGLLGMRLGKRVKDAVEAKMRKRAPEKR